MIYNYWRSSKSSLINFAKFNKKIKIAKINIFIKYLNKCLIKHYQKSYSLVLYFE